MPIGTVTLVLPVATNQQVCVAVLDILAVTVKVRSPEVIAVSAGCDALEFET